MNVSDLPFKVCVLLTELVFKLNQLLVETHFQAFYRLDLANQILSGYQHICTNPQPFICMAFASVVVQNIPNDQSAIIGGGCKETVIVGDSHLPDRLVKEAVVGAGAASSLHKG